MVDAPFGEPIRGGGGKGGGRFSGLALANDRRCEIFLCVVSTMLSMSPTTVKVPPKMAIMEVI